MWNDGNGNNDNIEKDPDDEDHLDDSGILVSRNIAILAADSNTRMWYVQAKHEYLSTKTEQDDDGHIVTGVPHIHDHFFEKNKKKTPLVYFIHFPRKQLFLKREYRLSLCVNENHKERVFIFFGKFYWHFVLCTK